MSLDPEEEHRKSTLINNPQPVRLTRQERQRRILIKPNRRRRRIPNSIRPRRRRQITPILREIHNRGVGNWFGASGVCLGDELGEEDGVLFVVPV